MIQTIFLNKLIFPLIAFSSRIKVFHLLLLLIFISPFSEGVANNTIDLGRALFWNAIGWGTLLAVITLGFSKIKLTQNEKYIYFLIAFHLLTIYTSKFLTPVFGDQRGLSDMLFLVPVNTATCILMVYLINDKNKLELFVSSLITFFVILTIFHFSIWLLGTNSLWKNNARFSGIFWDPNIHVRNVSIFLAFLFTYKIKNVRSVLHKAFLILIAILGLVLANFSYSRSGAVCLVIAILWASWKNFSKKHFTWILIIVSSLGVLFIASTIQNRFKKDSYVKGSTVIDFSTLQRVFMIDSAFRILEDHWLLGVGFGNFDNNYLKHYHSPIAKPFLKGKIVVTSIHTWFLKVWTEQGLPGLLSIIAFSFLILKRLWHISTKARDEKLVQITNCVILGFFMFYFFGITYHTFIYEHFYWVILGFALCVIRIYSQEEESLVQSVN